jgi:hypothetical protein
MEAWAAFWKIVFFVSITAFAAMSVWVIIGGFFDIKRMFADLKPPEDPKPPPEK